MSGCLVSIAAPEERAAVPIRCRQVSPTAELGTPPGLRSKIAEQERVEDTSPLRLPSCPPATRGRPSVEPDVSWMRPPLSLRPGLPARGPGMRLARVGGIPDLEAHSRAAT